MSFILASEFTGPDSTITIRASELTLAITRAVAVEVARALTAPGVGHKSRLDAHNEAIRLTGRVLNQVVPAHAMSVAYQFRGF